MKKFKCIKNYPNGPDIETVVEYYDNWSMYDINSLRLYSKEDIENYPEFWQELIEKDYEILMYRSKNNSCIYFDNPKYFSSLNSDWGIFSIRRLSDGVEFKIGDKVCWDWAVSYNKYFTIKSFEIDKDDLKFDTVEQSMQGFSLNSMKSSNFRLYKEPILTTEDGYECTLDDRVFGVCIKGSWETCVREVSTATLFIQNKHKEKSDWLYFKTAENRDKYIYENKPEFSRKQILDVISKIGINEPYLFGFRYDKPVMCADIFKQNLKL